MSKGACDLRCTPPVVIRAIRQAAIFLFSGAQGVSVKMRMSAFRAHLLTRAGYRVYSRASQRFLNSLKLMI